MKFALAVIASVIVGLIAFVGYTEAFQQTVRYEGSSTGASASAFELHDGTEISVYLSTDDSTTKTDGVMTENSSLWLDVYYTEIGDPDNYEDDVYQNYSGYVDLQPADFTVSPKLSSAQLSAQKVELCKWRYDVDGSNLPIPPEPDCMMLNVSVVWSNPGYLELSGGTSYHRGQDCSSDDRYSYKSRSADAQLSIVDVAGNQIISGPTDPMSAWIYSSSWKGKTRGCDIGCAASEPPNANMSPRKFEAGLKPSAGGCF